MADVTLSWIQRHERILIAAMVLAVGGWSADKLFTNIAEKDKAQANIALQQLADQKTANAQLIAQVQQTYAQYQQTIAQLSQQNAQLSATVLARNAATTKQQVVDKTLPLPDLASRWHALTPNTQFTDFKAIPDGVQVSDAGARATVQALEQVPVLSANYKDLEQVSSNQKAEIDSASNLIAQGKSEITGLKSQLVDSDKACKAQITAVKADARKGKLQWFKWGFITGFVSGILAGRSIP